ARRYTRHAAARLARIGREALARTLEIAERCTFTLDELRYEYPHELVPAGATAMEHLEELVWAGAAETYCGRTDAHPGNAAASATGFARSLRHSALSSLRRSVIPSLPGNINDLLNAELALIRDLGYEHYFLTVHDLVRFARSRGILCQGRGSAANSAVCYCLGVTAVDPARHDLLFERFISRERNEPPDIDVDFEHERREEVFQYIYRKYGRERAGITAEVISYRPRSAVRDVGKALGLSLDAVDVLAKAIDWFDDQPLPEHALQSAGIDANDRTIRMLVRLVRQILGFPRHLSQHVGGFVITETPLCEIVPLENGAMPERTFIEWNKDDIDALGILKVDCLALGMLTAVRKCLGLLERERDQGSGIRALRDIPAEDPRVYDMICRADTVGVFQIESRAQMSMLPRLKPRNFYDLVIEVAIVRPGPIQGGMVHPYLRRRDGLEEITYPSDDVRRVLHKTLGVPIFQEQVMRLAVVAAGFTPGEADQLRRAMAAWRRSGDIQKFQVKLIRGMLAKGYSREFAEQIYRQIQGFGEYGFPESHSASFAILVYASAWLKRYHPAAFCAAMLNSQPLGFYTPGQLIRDAIAHGVEVRPVDVLHSEWDCTLEEGDGGTESRSDAAKGDDDPAMWGKGGPALRLGLRLVRGLSQDKTAGITPSLRPFVPSPLHASVPSLLRAFLHHSSRDTLLRLTAADAFRSFGLTRRQALWRVLALDRDDGIRRRGRAPHTPTLFAELEPDEPPAELPQMPLEQTVVQDYDAQGFSLNAHPLGLVREDLERIDPNRVKPSRTDPSRTDPSRDRKGAVHRGMAHERASRTSGAMPRARIVRAADLKTLRHGQRVAVAGLVTLRQRPGTAKGMVFMTLEDETGMANLVIRPNVWERERRVARGSAALIAEGIVERKGEVIHVMARRFFDLADVLKAMQPEPRGPQPKIRHASRDFH
ncbi:MAG: error-prone DNA polymerase, partial [Phycisphaerae bacterium]|nr:error-prone DNA polymerase [Phycisphaerae bacterium]